MRPRVFPAEDMVLSMGRRPASLASMRPRVFPAEDAAARPRPHRALDGFNEAAGIPRGRPVEPTAGPSTCASLQ